MNPVFLTAEWRKLILINYSVDPDILQPYLPYGTELDFWNGKCLVSLVGFNFLNTRLKGFAVPFHRNFEEINLRFYVKHNAGNEVRRGVTFISEIVPKPALAFVANTVYKEKYIALPTQSKVESENDLLNVSYSWKFRRQWNEISVQTSSAPSEMATGSEEEFITEHYWGYTPVGNRLSSQYQVEHPRWQMYEVRRHQVNVDFGGLYGAEFGQLKDQLPESVMLAEGSQIVVRGAEKIR